MDSKKYMCFCCAGYVHINCSFGIFYTLFVSEQLHLFHYKAVIWIAFCARIQ